ncbi:MAG: ArsR family transcriptional regulator, partial [Pseudomonadota bacterium]|nr:ArsR family transcriptional regulator [Pseudomonadota bacterium]
FRHLVAVGPGGATPGELELAVDVAGATLSFHLKALVQAGLIAAEQNGRSITYRADSAAMQALVGYLTDHCCGGDPSLCAPARPRKRAQPAR